jgi:hypothetical protein
LSKELHAISGLGGVASIFLELPIDRVCHLVLKVHTIKLLGFKAENKIYSNTPIAHDLFYAVVR